MTMRSVSMLTAAVCLAAASGCEKQSKLVYVLEEPQTVTLIPSASATSVQLGDTVVLHLERRVQGKWKAIPLESARPGQCWVYRPPGEVEPEAADAVEWDVLPEGAVAFNREYRMDHTKIATVQVTGTITLRPRSAVKCEPDRVVEGPPIEIEVR